MNLIASAKVIFCLIIVRALRLNFTVNGSFLRSSPIKATSAVSSAVSVPAPPIAIPTVEAANAGASLTPSTVGIAMGGVGTDTALETADVALMGDDTTHCNTYS